MTIAAVEGGEVARLDIGRVVSATLRTLGRRWLALLLLGLPFVILPNLLVPLAAPEDIPYARLLAGLPPMVFVGGATLIAYHDIGEGIGVGRAIGAGLRKFGSLWLVAIISSLAMIVGLVLLVVPGVLISAIFATAASAVMLENLNSSRALQRAWDLSSGSRWRLVALLAIALFAVALSVLLIGVLAAVAEIVAVMAGLRNIPTEFVWASLIVLAYFSITTVGSTAAYVELRRAKEGGGEQLTQVFD